MLALAAALLLAGDAATLTSAQQPTITSHAPLSSQLGLKTTRIAVDFDANTAEAATTLETALLARGFDVGFIDDGEPAARADAAEQRGMGALVVLMTDHTERVEWAPPEAAENLDAYRHRDASRSDLKPRPDVTRILRSLGRDRDANRNFAEAIGTAKEHECPRPNLFERPDEICFAFEPAIAIFLTPATAANSGEIKSIASRIADWLEQHSNRPTRPKR